MSSSHKCAAWDRFSQQWSNSAQFSIVFGKWCLSFSKTSILRLAFRLQTTASKHHKMEWSQLKVLLRSDQWRDGGDNALHLIVLCKYPTNLNQFSKSGIPLYCVKAQVRKYLTLPCWVCTLGKGGSKTVFCQWCCYFCGSSSFKVTIKKKWAYLTLNCLFSSRSLCTSACSRLYSSMIFFPSPSSSEALDATGSEAYSVLTEEVEECTVW